MDPEGTGTTNIDRAGSGPTIIPGLISTIAVFLIDMLPLCFQLTITVCIPNDLIVVIVVVIVFVDTVEAATAHDDVRLSIGDLDLIDAAVLHGNGQVLSGSESLQRGQKPVPFQLGHADQRVIRKGDAYHIRRIQGHLQMIKQLRDLNFRQALNGVECSAIFKVNGKAAEGREAFRFKYDGALVIDLGLDGAGVTLVIHMDHIDSGMLVQLHIRDGQLHLDRGAIGLPIVTLPVLHRNVVQEDLLRVVAQLIDLIFHSVRCLLRGILNRQRASFGDTNCINGDIADLHSCLTFQAFRKVCRLVINRIIIFVSNLVAIEDHLQQLQCLRIMLSKMLLDESALSNTQNIPIMIDIHRILGAQGDTMLLQSAAIGMARQILSIRTAITDNFSGVFRKHCRGCLHRRDLLLIPGRTCWQ